MKAAVFYKPGSITYDTIKAPEILKPTDVILKVTSGAMCGQSYTFLVEQFRKAKT